MANSKKTTEPVEQASEKTCSVCGHVNPAEAAFCGSCGKKLDLGKYCKKCGALIAPESKFCMQCGCASSEQRVCSRCGAPVGDNYKFCPKCGASAQNGGSLPAGAAPYPAQQAPAAQPYYGGATGYAPPPPQPKTSFRQKVVDFENRRHLMSNLVVLVMSFIFLMVALFAPVEVAINGVGGMGDGVYGATNSVAVDQTIYQVFDAYDYIGLDYNNSYDQRKIEAVRREFATALERADDRLRSWYAYNQSATEEEIVDRMYSYLMSELDGMNMIAFMLVLSTQGVYDAWSADFGFEGSEAMLNDSLNCTYSSAVYSLAVATVIAVMQIALAIMSLVFMIIAICNLVRKKPGKPFKYLFLSLLLSGIALIIGLVAPDLIPGGAVMAIGILSTIAYIACGMVAYTKKDNYIVMIRRGILCFLGLIVFFSITADSITFFQETYEIGPGGADYTGSMVDGSVNLGISGLMSYMMIYRLNGMDVNFTPASASSMAFVSVLGIITTIVLFVMLLGYLRMLSDPNGKPAARLGTWFMIAGAACMLVLAVGCAILGGIGDIPASGGTQYMLVRLLAEANSGWYATLVFAAIAIVFDFVYTGVALKKPETVAANAVTAPQVAAQPTQPENVEQPTENTENN